MPKLTLSDGAELFYRVDDFTDPWTKPETILMLHGNSENSGVWYAWVPTLARHYRTVRPDMRGFGQSTPMPADFEWSLDVIVDDYISLMDSLGIEKFQLLAAKIGTTVARRFAARYPDRIKTLVLVGAPPAERDNVAANVGEWVEEFRREGGIKAWAERTMRKRLGSAFPEEGIDWWIETMGKTASSTQVGFMQFIPMANVAADLPKIACPSLVVTTEGSALGTVEETQAWVDNIPNSRLLVLPTDSYHVAASDAEHCAAETLAFIKENSPG
jgi:3-oxoadipate enol-lactonase